MKKKYDRTVARIAGNLLSGADSLPYVGDGVHGESGDKRRRELARQAVALARAIVAEAERTEPKEDADGQ